MLTGEYYANLIIFFFKRKNCNGNFNVSISRASEMVSPCKQPDLSGQGANDLIYQTQT